MNNITLSTDHIYRVDGETKSSVTQIIGRAGLDPNKNFYSKKAAQRGNDIHFMLEQYDLGTLNIGKVPKKYRGYLKAYCLFIKFAKPVWDIDGIEQTFYNPEYDICGTRDRVGSIIWQGKRYQCVLDIKSGPKAYWHGIQLAGYTLDIRYSHERIGLYLKDNGTYTIEHYTNPEDYEIFIKSI